MQASFGREPSKQHAVNGGGVTDDFTFTFACGPPALSRCAHYALVRCHCCCCYCLASLSSSLCLAMISLSVSVLFPPAKNSRGFFLLLSELFRARFTSGLGTNLAARRSLPETTQLVFDLGGCKFWSRTHSKPNKSRQTYTQPSPLFFG